MAAVLIFSFHCKFSLLCATQEILLFFKVDRQVVACHSRSKWQLLSAK